jgi:hypothetical protein
MVPVVDSGLVYRRNGKEEVGKAVVDGRSDEVERWEVDRIGTGADAEAVVDEDDDNEDENKDSEHIAGFERKEAYCMAN